MRGKQPIEQVVRQVRATMDVHDAKELEQVAMEKIVKCVWNKRRDPSPPTRPPRKVIPPPISPAISSPTSSPLRVNNDFEKGQVGELENSDLIDEQGEEDEPENDQVSHDDEESLEIVGETNKEVPLETLASRRKGKEVQMQLSPRTIQLKRPLQSRTPKGQEEGQLPAKRVRKTPVV